MANKKKSRRTWLYDIEICVGVEELKRTIRFINAAQWGIVSMTQDDGIYTVLFRRPCGEGTA